VQEILGQIPHWIIRWGITVIFLTITLILVGSWFFQYPDIITSTIVVTTTHPPASVVARVNGKLDRLFVEDQRQVKHGDVLACIENTARYEDVVHLQAELQTLRESLAAGGGSRFAEFREDYSLGTLQARYANFLSRYEEYGHVSNQEYQQQKIAALDKQIQHYQSLYTRSTRQKTLLQQELDLSERQYTRYQHLKEQALVSQKDLETLQSAVLQKRYAIEAAEANLDEIKLQVARLEASKLELTFQREEQQNTLKLNLEEAYDTLSGQIAAWEHANLLKAPIDGTITFTDYWSENQNVKAGDVVMTIVPDESSSLLVNSLLGKVRLPIQGSGKVKVGQQVNIKFANYPYREYGGVAGRVARISLVPSDNYYAVEVLFPEGLTTTYGITLPFTQEMQGTAEVITEDIRLLERFFQPIRALLTQHVS
jgi:HlyD family secretion protein